MRKLQASQQLWSVSTNLLCFEQQKNDIIWSFILLLYYTGTMSFDTGMFIILCMYGMTYLPTYLTYIY